MPNNQELKIKLLVLYDILYRKKNEENAMTSDEIVEELKKREITVSRRVIASDIALLNEYGYEVLSYKKKSYYYYVSDRRFENAEISMLADAVKASKLNRNQKEKVGYKLSEEAGIENAVSNSKYIINCDAPKHSNSQILYSIDAIEQAISQKKKISFLYYCIDRMEKVQVEDCAITPKSEFEKFNIEQYRTQVFSMFDGELETVELEFTEEMLNDIYDRFGEDINVKSYSDNKYRITVPIRISPNFFFWILGSKGKIHVISSTNVIDNFNQFFDEIKKVY